MADRDRYRRQLQAACRELEPAGPKVVKALVSQFVANYKAQVQTRRVKMKVLKPNKDGIAKLIAIIKRPKQHFIMGSFDSPYINKKGEACGTAYCIAGYASVLTGEWRDGVVDSVAALNKLLSPDNYTAAPDQAASDFSVSMHNLWNGYGISLTRFDTMPEKSRKAAAIDVLERFGKTGKVDWLKSARKFGYVHDPKNPYG